MAVDETRKLLLQIVDDQFLTEKNLPSPAFNTAARKHLQNLRLMPQKSGASYFFTSYIINLGAYSSNTIPRNVFASHLAMNMNRQAMAGGDLELNGDQIIIKPDLKRGRHTNAIPENKLQNSVVLALKTTLLENYVWLTYARSSAGGVSHNTDLVNQRSELGVIPSMTGHQFNAASHLGGQALTLEELKEPTKEERKIRRGLREARQLEKDPIIKHLIEAYPNPERETMPGDEKEKFLSWLKDQHWFPHIIEKRAATFAAFPVGNEKERNHLMLCIERFLGLTPKKVKGDKNAVAFLVDDFSKLRALGFKFNEPDPKYKSRTPEVIVPQRQPPPPRILDRPSGIAVPHRSHVTKKTKSAPATQARTAATITVSAEDKTTARLLRLLAIYHGVGFDDLISNGRLLMQKNTLKKVMNGEMSLEPSGYAKIARGIDESYKTLDLAMLQARAIENDLLMGQNDFPQLLKARRKSAKKDGRELARTIFGNTAESEAIEKVENGTRSIDILEMMRALCAFDCKTMEEFSGNPTSAPEDSSGSEPGHGPTVRNGRNSGQKGTAPRK